MKGLMIFLIAVLLSTATFSQWQNKKIRLAAGSTVSEAFKVTGGYWLSGIQLTTDLAENQDSCFFLVTTDPALGYDTLKFEGGTYWISFENNNEAVALDVSVTFQWPWWKVVFDQIYGEQTVIGGENDYYFYTQFVKP